MKKIAIFDSYFSAFKYRAYEATLRGVLSTVRPSGVVNQTVARRGKLMTLIA